MSAYTINRRFIESMFRIAVIALLIIVLASKAYSQDESTGHPQFTETAWITTDRQIYLPGEFIDFSVIVFETDTYLASTLSKVIKVELLDSEGSAIMHKEYLLDDSKADNRLLIPSSVATGWYYLRAYTNWMRNRNDLINYFLPLKIVRPDKLTETSLNNRTSGNVITFIPENGKLLPGVVNHCAIKAEDSEGSKIDIEATLLTIEGDTVVEFSTDITGWGEVFFIHQSETDYTIVSHDFASGEHSLIINEKEPSKGVFKYSISNNSIRISARELDSDSIKVLVHRNYTLYKHLSVNPVGGNLLLTVPINKLPKGIFQVSILSGNKEVLSKRLFTNGEPISGKAIIVNKLKPGTDKHILSAYTLENNMDDENTLRINNIVTRSLPEDIFDNYIPGLPGWPISYDIPAGKEAREGWLIANSYPDEVSLSFHSYSAQTLLQPEYNPRSLIDIREGLFRYLPETRGFVISGSIKDDIGNPIANQPIAATMLTDNSMVAGFSFSSGNFHLFIPETEGLNDFIIGPTSSPPLEWSIDLESRFDKEINNLPIREFKLSLEEIKYIRELDLNRQIEAIYNTMEASSADTINNTSTKVPFYDAPSFRVVVDKFIRLTNLREVIYEVVPRVSVRNNRGSYSMVIIGDPPLPEKYAPLFMLDGIPIYEFDELLELPPDRFLSIEVIDKLYIHGNAIFSGIVGFYTVNGDLGGLPLPEGLLVTSYEMPHHSISRIFEMTETDKNIPQLDATLYWKAFQGKLSENYSFYLNDNPGELINLVYGFNKSGQWIYTKKTITFDSESH